MVERVDIVRIGNRASARRGRGFSLVELLVVIGIIVLLAGILLPALSGARRAARSTATQAQITDLGNAIDSFRADNQRLPGYFSPVQMGSPDNADSNRGLTALENAMLDLAGGIVDADDPNANIVELNPTTDSDEDIFVNIDLIGAVGGPGYYTPPQGRFEVNDFQAAGEGALALPDVMDANGSPLMLWARDEGASGTLVNPDVTSFGPGDLPIALVDSSGDTPAAFYLASNYGVLAGGRSSTESMLGEDTVLNGSTLTAEDREISLAAVLGSPSFPSNTDADGNAIDFESTNTNDYEDIFPSALRGSYMLMSAGSDEVFFETQRAPRLDVNDAVIRYGANFFGEDQDVMKAFDDLFIARD
ncbi:MAG: prepilin-type N-terminal cleavage/methylation domain-containing protein [Planctomycetota bacterium]